MRSFEKMQTLKKEVTVVICERCGNTWQPRVRKPVKCPKCGHRFDAKIMVDLFHIKEMQKKVSK